MNEQNMNAMETWPLYDSVLIGEGQSSDIPGGYETYAQLGQATKIPFFSDRTRSNTGIPYNNMDTAETLSFAYTAKSLGIGFMAAPFVDTKAATVPVEAKSQANNMVFTAELLKHVAFRFQLSQDEKVFANCLALPEGAGASGFTQLLAGPGQIPVVGTGTFTQYRNGIPYLMNRYLFPEGLEMPRNVNLSGEIHFSEYARDFLKVMEGPGRILVDPTQLAYDDATHPSVSMIRVSFFGQRAVQQRNALHF